MNAFRKDVYREIKNTFGRFIAIFAIVLLGVSFFTGIGSTGLDMKITGDGYFSGHNLMDIRVVSTYGINKNDIAAIKKIDGVEAVYPAYNIDALVDTGDSQSVVKIHSITGGGDSYDSGGGDSYGDSGGGVNLPSLISGRMPLAANEAVTEKRLAEAFGYKIGDVISLKSGRKADLRDSLKNVRYKLVGIVNSVYYVSNAERGSSAIGNGSVDYFMYIPEANFRQNVYSEVFVTLTGGRSLQCFGDEYKDLAEAVSDRLEELGDIRVKERYLEATDVAYRGLESAEEALYVSKAAAADEFDELYSQIDDAGRALDEARRDLVIKFGDIYEGRKAIDDAKTKLRSGASALDQAIDKALVNENGLARAGIVINEALQTLDLQSTGLAEKEAIMRAFYIDDPEALAALLKQLSESQAKIGATRESLQNDFEAAHKGEAAVKEVRAALIEQRLALEANFQSMFTQEAGIEDGEIELTGGYVGLTHNINELDRQLSQIIEQETDALMQMDASASAIRDARKTLNDMDRPKWYVMDRDSNPGYAGYFGDADKVEAIGKVFPAIFFIVAALVCLTTMTRLVEERRIEIGTLKSLGYSDFKIISKYLIYAALPTMLGGFTGGFLGMRFFPVTIIMAYKSLYALPQPMTVLNTQYMTIGVAIAAVSTLGATMAACANELRATPAVLMRPKPPKRGARIFIERLTLIWNSVSFTWKVTIRNIVRYKKRFWMTIAGIAGCMALLMTGFGLRDSIQDMINLQYGDVNLYDMNISFTDNAKVSDLDSVQNLLRDSKIVRSSMRFRQKQYDAGSANNSKTKITVNLIVPSDLELFGEYTVLRDRLTHKKLTFVDNEVVLSEKLAKRLGVGRGDSFYIDCDGERVDMTVSDVTENYYLHYIYMPEGLYTRLFGKKPAYNAIYVLLGDYTDDERQALANDILEKKNVAALFLTSTIFGIFNRVIGSLNFVIFVLIVSAAALAVVVLLNLTGINISERKRELATIEVLGFYDREVSSYIYRENIVLTLLGAAAGLLLGAVLHAFVIQTAETDIMMFGRRIKTESYLYSVLLTIVFSTFVNLITARRLRNINMVEALKSVE